jgi:hypothetical protein
MARNMSAIAAAALALAACGGGEPEEREAGGESLSPGEAQDALGEVARMRPGEYRSRMEVMNVSIPGIPEAQAAQMGQMMGGGSNETTFCLTPEEAEQGPGQVVQEMAEGDCSFSRLDTSGTSIDAEMQCTSAQGVVGRYTLAGEITPESSAMTMQIDQAVPGVPGEGRMQMEMRVTSERIGDCV